MTLSTRAGKRPSRLRSRPVRVVLGAAVAAPALALATLNGAAAAPLTTTAGDSAPTVDAASALFVYSVHSTSGDVLALANRLNEAGYTVAGRDDDTLWIEGPASLRARLAAEPGLVIDAAQNVSYIAPDAGVDADQDPILPKKLHGNHYETFYGGYRTVDAFHQFEDDLADAYPKLVKVYDYGESWTEDNPLRAVCITLKANKGCELSPDTKKARFFLMGEIHARELTTGEITWRYMTDLIDGAKKNADIKALLKDTEVWVVPQFNPDGIQIVEDGIEEDGTGADSPAYQRKNANDSAAPPDGCPPPWESSHPGIDLNRNYGSHWGGASTSPNPCSEVYKGTDADSEPETSAVEALFNDLFKDQRGDGADDPAPKDTTGAMITLHTYANLTLLPWGYSSAVKAPNDAGLRSFGFRTSFYNHYRTGQPGEVLYNASGTTDDWTYDKLGIASFTWEMGPGGGECGGFLPLYSCQDSFWDLNKPALHYAAKAARAPYMMSLGPTTSGVKVKSLGGGDYKIKATSDDNAYGTSGVGRPAAQNVKKMRVFIGKAPWKGGTAINMNIKGAGTSVTGSVTVAAGKKKQLAYVQGRDADGNWGPVAAVWIPKK